MAGWNDFSGLNQGALTELYGRYRANPESVDEATRTFFDRWPAVEDRPGVPRAAEAPALPVSVVVGAVTLADAIRRYGHLAARLDPLGAPPQGDPALDPATHGITDDDLRSLPASLITGPLCDGVSTAFEAIAALRRIYCSTIGYDYAHIFIPEERQWLRDAAECGRFRAPADPIDPLGVLDRLTEVEAFERFLHRTFPGKTRFSIEGLDMLVPLLDEVIAEAADTGTRHVLIGMAHRGRLNILAHVLHRPYAQILAEFKDTTPRQSFREDMAWTGDVKYHLGAHRAVRGGEAVDLTIAMPPNPSHLEAIDPIVEGMARAAGTDARGAGRPRFDAAWTLPILIHGDASFQGQGVVAETLNLSRLEGYTTGGTIHIIGNNQLGFTTTPRDLYSTLYASGLARGFKIPIVHVNADDPEACIEAARLAFAYRRRFGKDFVIDLVGYRRYGHNEGDEPAFTQPLMYRTIAAHPPVRVLWARTLAERGLADEPAAEERWRRAMQRLQSELEALGPEQPSSQSPPPAPPPGSAAATVTAVPFDTLRELNAAVLALPAGFTPHRKLSKARERRSHALDDPEARSVDWATAEELAFASILADGISIRLTGEDVERGTFSQRHAVFHDAETGDAFTPLASLPQARAGFEVHNSPLTENAVLAFEYGYNVQTPGHLVLWEAQYGDFINGAQVVVDEFLVSARAKWGQTPSLVLLLPHGAEGQGPDHASARPERLLQLAADINLRVANCTTAAQYFHLLRRQALLLDVDPLPLVILTPKSLLRHPLVASAPRELAEGRWEAVIDDDAARGRTAEVRRLVLCSGKIYVDLVSSALREQDASIAVCRLEQLTPVPTRAVDATLARYPNLAEIVWTQEEPENMGAWEYLRPYLEAAAVRHPRGRSLTVSYVGRPRSASPAEGSAAHYAANQEAIVTQALTRGVGEPQSAGRK